MINIEWLDSIEADTPTTVESKVVKTFTTPNGKGIQIVMDGDYNFYSIEFASGGEKPEEFDGVHTTVISAEVQVSKYLARKQKEAEKKAEKSREETPILEEKDQVSAEPKRKQAV